ncbi:MAG TPA: hypothetical protein VN699_15940 [Pirellulales bacterium]|nr:hypothetical protein [Pirellulales bacterium]
MNDFWQDGAAICIVALAGGYLLRRAWLLFGQQPKSGCGAGCGGCPGRSSDGAPLIAIELSRPRSPQG